MKRNALHRAQRPRAIYITRNVGLDVRGDNHAQSQHFYINGAFLPLGEMKNEQLSQLLSELGKAALSERRVLGFAYTAIAIAGPLFYLSVVDAMERRAIAEPVTMAVGVLVFAFSLGLWSVRAAPWAPWLQDRRDSIAELNSPRRAVLAEIAIRRARGTWPSHGAELLRYLLFAGRIDAPNG